MNAKSLTSAALALSLSLPALSSMAAINPNLLGEATPATAAERTIKITPDTQYVNVHGGQIVTFDVGGQTFTWDFDGAAAADSFDLNQIMPPGLLDHPVRAYVSPNPLYIG
jgi:hypothetical protein